MNLWYQSKNTLATDLKDETENQNLRMLDLTNLLSKDSQLRVLQQVRDKAVSAHK